MYYDGLYTKLCTYLLNEGVWINNKRTGKKCLTGNTQFMQYDCNDPYPMLTLRRVFPYSAIAEILGYWQGRTSAADFRELGTKTWDANANKTKAWLANPLRKGEDDMGHVYGYFGHNFGGVNQFEKVYNNLKNGVDDRGEIITYWKPDQFNEGCLRPCLHTLQFTLLGDTLHLQMTQRSTDVPLGLVSNSQQGVFMLKLMSKITGHKAGIVTHIINQPHIYEDQVDSIKELLQRKPKKCFPILEIDKNIKTWDDVMNIDKAKNFFSINGYESNEKIIIPFSE